MFIWFSTASVRDVFDRVVYSSWQHRRVSQVQKQQCQERKTSQFPSCFFQLQVNNKPLNNCNYDGSVKLRLNRSSSDRVPMVNMFISNIHDGSTDPLMKFGPSLLRALEKQVPNKHLIGCCSHACIPPGCSAKRRSRVLADTSGCFGAAS